MQMVAVYIITISTECWVCWSPYRQWQWQQLWWNEAAI